VHGKKGISQKKISNTTRRIGEERKNVSNKTTNKIVGTSQIQKEKEGIPRRNGRKKSRKRKKKKGKKTFKKKLQNAKKQK